MLGLFSCNSSESLDSVKPFNLNKYLGTWYEIARLPNSFEKGLSCVSATYSLKENGKIKVFNKGFKSSKNEYKEITGSARVLNDEYPSQLKVTFFWPFAGDYYVIDINEDYTIALVGDPSRKFLWILARDKKISDEDYQRLTQLAKSKGFETESLLKVEHNCD